MVGPCEQPIGGEKAPSLPSCLPDLCSAPWFVFIHGKRYKSHTFFSIPKGRFYVRNIPELRKYICEVTSYRCIAMYDPQSSRFFLWNPVTMVRVELPQMYIGFPPDGRLLMKVILSTSPFTDYGCRVMCFNPYGRWAYFCHLGNKVWIVHDYDYGQYGLIKDIVSCKGQFYGITLNNNLAIFNFDSHPRTTILEIASPGQIRSSLSVKNLVESCGQIFLVERFFMRRFRETCDIQVLKLDLSNQRWEEVDDIGDQVFFLNDASVSWSGSQLGVKKSCIYFTEPFDKHLYVYDMEEGTISRSLPCPNVKQRQWRRPFFLMLQDAL